MGTVKVEMNELLNFSEAARLLGVSRQTIYNYIDEGKLHPVSFAGSRYILRSEVDELNQREAKG